MFDDWTRETTFVAIGLVGSALVLTISLAVQRFMYAANLRRAEREGDLEAIAALVSLLAVTRSVGCRCGV